MYKKKPLSYFVSLVLIISIAFGVSITHVELVHAAGLNTLSDSLSTAKVGFASDHTIQFVTPTGVTSGQNITITFPNGWTMGNLATTSIDFATSTSATCSGFADVVIGSSVPSGLAWGVATTSNIITFTSGTAVIPANRCIQIRLGSNATFQGAGTTTIINPSSATSSIINIAGSFGDTGQITVNIITDDTVAVTATVAQAFTFTISTSTIYFGTLSSSQTKYASSTNPLGDTLETIAHTLQVSTNAPSGYTVTIRGQTLTSQQSASNTINFIGPTAASSTVGIEQFGIRATSTGGSGAAVDPTYGALTSYGYDATATSSAIFATGSGATNTTTFGLRYVANIATLTEAGTYTSNVVFVATANY
jgi:hypothetical protein